MNKHVTLFEMGPRDGLQNEKADHSLPRTKYSLINLLSAYRLEKNRSDQLCIPEMGASNGGCC